MLDEGLEVLRGLWTGQPFSYSGKHFQIKEVTFRPTPVQQHIPIWVGGNWPNKGPQRRAAHHDGYFPIKWEGGMSPADWREALTFIKQHRQSDRPFDAVHGGKVPDDQWHKAESVVAPYAEAGVTWWIEDVSPWRFGADWEKPWQPEDTPRMLELVRRGPPRL
jgi:alkanesulfonate monooxygenase SsuD/methylene tetrahydromethanopterin reductase-like flavin-dependent oxidoreductase (luciferase family)